MDQQKTILAYALQNAVRFNGKANPGAVIGKVIGDLGLAKDKIPEIAKEVQKVVKEVNALGVEKQTKQLQQLAPELLEKKTHEHDLFAFLKIQKGEKITTAFPPEPSKYPHIGHAKAILINYELAKRHKGKFILRFEDTNPTLAKKEFYDIHLENYKWLGVKPDKVTYASDHVEDFYKHIENMLKQGQAYTCSCTQEEMKAKRAKGEPCSCRPLGPEENVKRYEEMKTAEEGKFIIRAKIDLEHKNSAMRDPALMRIMDEPHCRTGKKYRLWPTYDFENAVMDGIQKITHRLRSKEFEMRNELQRYLQRQLGYDETSIYEFARFNMQGVESSGRIIREKITNKELWGWDDPSLTTLVALKRRGFQPEAIKSFVLSTGITKAESTMTWDDLIMHNRRLLDDKADRYFFVADPVKVNVIGAPKQEISLPVHPTIKRGQRKFKTGEEFYIAKDDLARMEQGKTYRLMGCINIEMKGKVLSYVEGGMDEYKKSNAGIFHWLPVEGNIKLEVLKPDHEKVMGLAEPSIKKLRQDTVIQFERFGFCRKDSESEFWFTHK